MINFEKEIVKVSTKNELKELLKDYKGLLNISVIDYLNSLIELEFSVMKNHLSENDKVLLSDLGIYKKVAIYNIYNRALNIFNSEDFEILSNENKKEGLRVFYKYKDNKIPVFDFDYGNRSEKLSRNEIIEDYMKICDINLYRTIEDKEKMLDYILENLDILHNQTNPYPSLDTYGSPASRWAFDHTRKIEGYQKRYNELDSRKELTDLEKKEIEINNKYNDLLLEDYGLKLSDFKEENDKYVYCKNTNLKKIYVKRISHINIKNNMRYV